MQEILFSQKQYQALMSRLDQITDDMKSIKMKSGPGSVLIDNYELVKLLKVTYRTIQRWRNSGGLPYQRIGRKFYYRLDLLVEGFQQPDNPK